MKLHSASRKELRRVAVGSFACLAAMLGVYFALGRLGYRVILSGILGTGVAIGNFAALCLTIQAAARVEDPKNRKARLQLSYHGRLLFQAAWMLTAFSVTWLATVAAAVPLLFPSAVILVLRGKE